MNRHLIAVVVLGVTLPGCSALAQSSQQLADVRQAITSVDGQLVAARTDDAKYAGGLIKALIESRIATLEQTKAMLEQRAHATIFTISVRYMVDGKLFVPPADAATQVASVEAELALMRVKIATDEAEAARYSGGLVQAMKLSTIATTRQTEAMLEQKRLALKFGLPQYIGFAGGQPSQSDGRVLPPAPSQDQPGQSRYEIVSIDARVTETNSSWWRYAWKLTVHNKSDMTMGFRAKIEFQDKDGFVIDDTNSDTFAVAAGADGTATGFALVRVPGASSVARTVAKVSAAR